MAWKPGAGNAAIFGLLVGGLSLGTLVVLPGCRPSHQEEGSSARSDASDAEWTWIQDAKARLDALRVRLAQVEAGAPAEPAGPEPADIVRLRGDISALSAELNQRLVAFINENARSVGSAGPAGDSGRGGKAPGAALDERLRSAIRLKSGEDALLARQFIEQGGDYRRAIEIYETALAADPDNEVLRKDLEAARARRYMTLERFKQVRETMTEDEVRRLLGPPNRQDVRNYPERGVTAWFYPKDASGAAAAVWFHSKGALPEVYLVDFEAIRPAGEPNPGGTPPRGTPPPPAVPAPAPGSPVTS